RLAASIDRAASEFIPCAGADGLLPVVPRREGRVIIGEEIEAVAHRRGDAATERQQIMRRRDAVHREIAAADKDEARRGGEELMAVTDIRFGHEAHTARRD